jgi:fucose 4-O-acetylase-like acetyltransferase
MSVNKKTINTSNIFDVVKVFAIISVILAHSRVNDSSLYSVLAERIGAIGVITFFFISGYFFNQSKYGVKIFFLKKVKSIFVP